MIDIAVQQNGTLGMNKQKLPSWKTEEKDS